MISQLKKLRRFFLGRMRFYYLKFFNSKIKVGKGFFCAGGCRISSGRHVVIGDNFYMGYNCHLGANMNIGNDVMFASNVAIVGGDHKIDHVVGSIREAGRDEFKTTDFGDGCWIGHGSILLHGIKIGKGAVVAAGSIY